jgi:hypothetical protein
MSNLQKTNLNLNYCSHFPIRHLKS